MEIIKIVEDPFLRISLKMLTLLEMFYKASG